MHRHSRDKARHRDRYRHRHKDKGKHKDKYNMATDAGTPMDGHYRV